MEKLCDIILLCGINSSNCGTNEKGSSRWEVPKKQIQACSQAFDPVDVPLFVVAQGALLGCPIHKFLYPLLESPLEK